jgi:hypothetical protein
VQWSVCERERLLRLLQRYLIRQKPSRCRNNIFTDKRQFVLYRQQAAKKISLSSPTIRIAVDLIGQVQPYQKFFCVVRIPICEECNDANTTVT